MSDKFNDIEIYKVRTKDKDNKFKNLAPHLLKPPFFLVVNAPPRTGKSNLLVNIIYNTYDRCFDNIIYISPNVFNDDTLKLNVAQDEKITKIHENLDQLDDIIQSIVDIQREKKENDEEEYTLLILDDCLGLLKKGLNKVVSKYAHYNMSIIVTMQSFRALHNICRACATGYILFKTANRKELLKMEDEFSGSFPDFMDLYETATAEKYNFLFLDFKNIKAYKNFTQLLWEQP